MKLLNKQGVESDQGFSVQITGRFSLEYREANLRISCDIEDGGLPMLNVDVPSTFEPPFSHGGVSLERRTQIIQNIRESLEFMGFFPIIR